MTKSSVLKRCGCRRGRGIEQGFEFRHSLFELRDALLEVTLGKQGDSVELRVAAASRNAMKASGGVNWSSKATARTSREAGLRS